MYLEGTFLNITHLKKHISTPSEEKALASYLLRMSSSGFPIPVKFLRSLALIIVCQLSSSLHAPSANKRIHPPGKNWAQGFYKRHPELKSRRVKPLDWNQHDNNIFDKVTLWFDVIGKELHEPAILPQNV